MAGVQAAIRRAHERGLWPRTLRLTQDQYQTWSAEAATLLAAGVTVAGPTFRGLPVEHPCPVSVLIALEPRSARLVSLPLV